MPCHCVEHTVAQVRKSLKTVGPFHNDSNFFARPLFRKLVAQTIESILFPAVIEGVVGFKTNNAYASLLPDPHHTTACKLPQ